MSGTVKVGRIALAIQLITPKGKKIYAFKTLYQTTGQDTSVNQGLGWPTPSIIFWFCLEKWPLHRISE